MPVREAQHVPVDNERNRREPAAQTRVEPTCPPGEGTHVSVGYGGTRRR